MFFCDEEGTVSSFQGVQETIEQQGLFSSFYSDRGSHYWHTPEAGGKVDKNNPTQFGRAMSHLGINMIAAYSPEARGRSERAFETHQRRLPNELAIMGITTMEGAIPGQNWAHFQAPVLLTYREHPPKPRGSLKGALLFSRPLFHLPAASDTLSRSSMPGHKAFP